MPKFLERKLKAEYGADSSIPYKVMNKLGVMLGNKETAKGYSWDRKHEAAEGKKVERAEHRTGKEPADGRHPARNLGAHLHAKGGGTVSMPKAQFVKEHTKLTRVLKSGTTAQRMFEASKQARELRNKR